MIRPVGYCLCGDFVLAGHPPSCPFYDLLDAIRLELEVEETCQMIRDFLPEPEEIRQMLLRFLVEGMQDPPPESDEG